MNLPRVTTLHHGSWNHASNPDRPSGRLRQAQGVPADAPPACHPVNVVSEKTITRSGATRSPSRPGRQVTASGRRPAMRAAVARAPSRSRPNPISRPPDPTTSIPPARGNSVRPATGEGVRCPIPPPGPPQAARTVRAQIAAALNAGIAWRGCAGGCGGACSTGGRFPRRYGRTARKRAGCAPTGPGLRSSGSPAAAAGRPRG